METDCHVADIKLYLFTFQTPSPHSASSESQLPGNRKDTKTVPKGRGRQSAGAASGGASCSSGKASNKSASARSADPYDSDQEELRDDPLYAPPGKPVVCGIKNI